MSASLTSLPALPSLGRLPQADITVAHHVTGTFLGITFNLDTIWTTLIAGTIVVGAAFLIGRSATSGVPGKVQLAWESVVEALNRQVKDNLGVQDPTVTPLAIALFSFILIANLLELIPSGDNPKILPAPTADVNLTYALALVVIVGVHARSISAKGLKGYVKHYFEPYPALFPLNLIEEIVKPFTLALRLFGNIFAGGIMIAVIGLIPIYAFWAPTILWKLFDLGIGVIQAFIFALLTTLYYAAASESHSDENAAHLDQELAAEGGPGSGHTGQPGHATVTLPKSAGSEVAAAQT